jgi:hypothetical protein
MAVAVLLPFSEKHKEGEVSGGFLSVRGLFQTI